jgi:hypothetical protein
MRLKRNLSCQPYIEETHFRWNCNCSCLVERSIRQDIHLTRLEYAKAAKFAVEFVDISDLLPKIVQGNAARDLQAPGMIRDTDIFITALLPPLLH